MKVKFYTYTAETIRTSFQSTRFALYAFFGLLFWHPLSSAAQNGPVCTAYTTYTTANGLNNNFFAYNNAIFVDGTNVYACPANGLDISNNSGTSFSTKTTAHGLANIDVKGVYAAGAIVFAATQQGLSQSINGGASFTTNASIGNVGTYCIAVSGTNVYVGTQNGVAISTDAGVTFTTTNIGLITSIAVSGTTVVAGNNSGLFISTNSGSSFTQKTRTNGLATNSVTSVKVVGGTIYVAMEDEDLSSPPFSNFPGGVDITTDNGATFTHKTTANGLGESRVFGIQVIGTTVYAATGSGLSISTNSGSSFTNYTTSNTTGFGGDYVRTIYATNSTIYVGTDNGLSACAVALPVELLDFTGKNTEGGNLLTWTTANEINNKGFQVERRQATGDSWDILGFKTANHKSSTYQFTDNAPCRDKACLVSTHYYRLRQIDNDGKETLSKVISIATKGNSKLKAYPNPVSNTLTVENTEGGNFQILNLLGQQVLSGKTTAQRIDVSALPQGSYVLKVGAEQVKFVKQ